MSDQSEALQFSFLESFSAQRWCEKGGRSCDLSPLFVIILAGFFFFMMCRSVRSSVDSHFSFLS